jgi:hypothetical protein
MHPRPTLLAMWRGMLPDSSPSPIGEGVGVRGRIPERVPIPTLPSQRFAPGLALSPLQGGEGQQARNSTVQ